MARYSSRKLIEQYEQCLCLTIIICCFFLEANLKIIVHKNIRLDYYTRLFCENSANSLSRWASAVRGSGLVSSDSFGKTGVVFLEEVSTTTVDLSLTSSRMVFDCDLEFSVSWSDL